MGKVHSVLVCWIIIFGLLMINMNFLSEKADAESYTIELIQTFPGEGPVSNAGDVNGDGFDDIIVGMKSVNNTGEAFIYYGGNIVDDMPDVHFKGESIGDEFGRDVSFAGDVNGDGYCDIIIGAPHNDDIADNSGKAYIYFGGKIMDNIPDLILTGEYIQDYFGSSVSTAYDVNKDGFDDILVGAWSYGETSKPNCGKVYLYFGNNLMDNIADITFTGKKDEFLGESVSSAGDINHDGFNDIIIGAPGNTNEPGMAYLFFGGFFMDNNSDVSFVGEHANDAFGTEVSSAGDINNDGFGDVLIGAPFNHSTGYYSGKAYLFLGGDSMDNISDKVWIGDEYSRIGSSLCNASDINNDGISDILIGADMEDQNPGDSKGAVHIYFGNNSIDNMEEYVIYGYDSMRAFGAYVSSGDIDNNGYSDIIIGSWDYVYVFRPNIAPSISIFEPDGNSDLIDNSFTITWVDEDVDNDAKISLYYCREGGGNSIPIPGANDLSEDNENDTFIWDTSKIVGGSYYIIAKIDDGINPVVWTNSPGYIIVNHHPIISINTPDASNHIADESFSIEWNDKDDEDNATISLFYDDDKFGNDGNLIVSAIGEDDSGDMYVWNTTTIPDGKYYIYAEIDDGINPIHTNYSSVPLTIHHKMPNLSIQDIGTTPSYPKIGKKVTINLTLINSGDKIAQNCVAELIIDGILIDEVNVNEVLPYNGTYDIVFKPFIPDSRIHSAQISVKINDEEVATQEITIRSEEKDELDLIFVLIPILLFALIIILLLIYLIKRRNLNDNTQKNGIESMEIPISCPSCSYSFSIPSEPRPLQIQCPNCGTKGIMK